MAGARRIDRVRGQRSSDVYGADAGLCVGGGAGGISRAVASEAVRLGGVSGASRVEAAGRHASRAVEIEPGHARAHVLLGEALLAAGNFLRGFSEYEWRLKCEGFVVPAGMDRAPRWTGREDVCGKTVLLLAEQGF